MPDKDKIGENIPENPDESTAEMEIIKDVFAADNCETEPCEQVFSQDLFSEPAAEPEPAEKPAPPPAPEPKARPAEPPPAPAKAAPAKSGPGKSGPGKSDPGKSGPGKAAIGKISTVKAAPAGKEPVEEPPPPPAPEKKASAVKKSASVETKDDSIKVVTDDDLRSLFDQSSPGIGPDEIESAPAAAESAEIDDSTPAVTPAAPKKAKIPAPAPPKPEVTPGAGVFAEEVEELDIESSPEPAPAPKPSTPEPAAPPEETVDEAVEQIETRASVGEITVAPAAKKGAALQQTEQALSGLSPIGDDFMSVDELKKLFNNVNVLTEWARETSERIGRIEAALEELKKGRGGK